MTEQNKEWSPRERTSWWIKYAVVISAAAGVITLVNMCGGRALGLMSTTDAKAEHIEIKKDFKSELVSVEVRLNQRIDDTVGRIEKSLDKLETKKENKKRPRTP